MVIKKICVFCSSSPKIDQAYTRDAVIFGKIIAEQKIELVYGGGAVGLMGTLADTVMKNNGIVNGVIPHFMIEREWGHSNISKLQVVKDMHERKRLMIADTDAVVAMPGGVGTLEELAEVITMKQLGKYVNPVIILNTNGFYNEFLLFLSRMIQEGFLHHKYKNIWKIVDKPEEILPAIYNPPVWSINQIKYAAFED